MAAKYQMIQAAPATNQAAISAATADPAGANNQSTRDVKVVFIPVTGDNYYYFPIITYR